MERRVTEQPCEGEMGCGGGAGVAGCWRTGILGYWDSRGLWGRDTGMLEDWGAGGLDC